MSTNAKLKKYMNIPSKFSTLSNNPLILFNQNRNARKNNALNKKIKETSNLIPKPKPNLNQKKVLNNNNTKLPPTNRNNQLKRNNNFSKVNLNSKPLTARERSRSYQSNRRKDMKSTPQSLNSNNRQSSEMKLIESTKDKTTNNNQCFNLDMPIEEINVWNGTIANDSVLTTNELKERNIKLQEGYEMLSRKNTQSIKSSMEFTNKHLNELKEHYKIFSDNKHQFLFNNSIQFPVTKEDTDNNNNSHSNDNNRNNNMKKDLQENINGISLGVFNINFENYQLNNSKCVSFTNKEYRQLLDTFSMLEYGDSILSDYFDNEIKIVSCLEKQDINPKMRMKMVDWMIEVFSSFKCGDITFFIAVMLMDRYFNSTDIYYTPNDLHLIGITCIFIASKFCDVYPIKLKVIIDKISHNKYTSTNITQMEDRIMTCLDFNILLPTTLEFLNYYFKDLFFFFENNFNIRNKKLSEYLVAFVEKMKLSIKLDMLYFDKCENCKKYTDNMINFLYCIIIYLAKMCCHDYDINSEKPSLIAASVLLVGLRICEEVNNESYVNELFLEKLTKVSRHNQYTILHLSQKVLFNAQNFEKVYCGMENLKLKHFDSLAAIQNTK